MFACDFATVVVIAAIFIASFTQGLVGFGFGLVAVPILVLFLSPSLVVPLICLLATVLTSMVLFEARKYVNIKKITPLFIGGVVGMPLGIWVLKVIDADLIKVSMGSIIVLFGIVSLIGFRRHVLQESKALGIIGLASGFLNSSTALSGPPVILFFSNQGWKKEEFRANIIAYFVGLNIITLVSFYFSGFLTSEVFQVSLYTFPPMILGTLVGIYLSRRVSQNVFAKLALIIVTGAGITSIISVL